LVKASKQTAAIWLPVLGSNDQGRGIGVFAPSVVIVQSPSFSTSTKLSCGSSPLRFARTIKIPASAYIAYNAINQRVDRSIKFLSGRIWRKNRTKIPILMVSRTQVINPRAKNGELGCANVEKKYAPSNSSMGLIAGKYPSF